MALRPPRVAILALNPHLRSLLIFEGWYVLFIFFYPFLYDLGFSPFLEPTLCLYTKIQSINYTPFSRFFKFFPSLRKFIL